MQNEPHEIFAAIMKHYGAEHQQLKLCEECGELIQAAIKAHEAGVPLTDDLIEEIADVSILLTQFESTFDDYWRELFEKYLSYKLRRQIERIEGETVGDV